MGLTHTMGRNHNIDIAINLTRDMNDFTKFAIMAMRGHWNVTGSGQVLGWQYGFPYAVDLSRRDQARHQTGETTSVDLLNRNEVEACFYIATDPGAHFPIDAMISSSKKPTVTVDPAYQLPPPRSPTSTSRSPWSVSKSGGCAYRMDNVPIETSKVVDPPEGMLTDEELLTKINHRVDELIAGGAEMSEYIIKNGHVFDPVQGIKGDRKDIAVKDGKIVERSDLSSSAKVIDAKGKTVMAGALEIHAHVAGPKVNAGRWYRPEDKHFDSHKNARRRPGSREGTPSRRSSRPGTTMPGWGSPSPWKPRCPRSMPATCTRRSTTRPSSTRQHSRSSETTGSSSSTLKNKEIENTAAYIAWLLRQTKGYGIKIVNPGAQKHGHGD